MEAWGTVEILFPHGVGGGGGGGGGGGEEQAEEEEDNYAIFLNMLYPYEIFYHAQRSWVCTKHYDLLVLQSLLPVHTEYERGGHWSSAQRLILWITYLALKQGQSTVQCQIYKLLCHSVCVCVCVCVWSLRSHWIASHS